MIDGKYDNFHNRKMVSTFKHSIIDNCYIIARLVSVPFRNILVYCHIINISREIIKGNEICRCWLIALQQLLFHPVLVSRRSDWPSNPIRVVPIQRGKERVLEFSFVCFAVGTYCFEINSFIPVLVSRRSKGLLHRKYIICLSSFIVILQNL